MFRKAALLALSLAWSAGAEPFLPGSPVDSTFEDRWTRLRPTPHELFAPPARGPRPEGAKACAHDLGALLSWASYGPERAFRGYVLFADPYDPRTGRVSFLRGSDCSHFTHRLFQAMGVDYGYMKTRTWIRLARGLSRPKDISRQTWEHARESFVRVSFEEARPGDLVVFDREQRQGGHPRGHIGVLSQRNPDLMLHAKGSKYGVVEEPLKLTRSKARYFFRYVGEMNDLPRAESWSELLARPLPRDPLNP